MPSAGFYTVQNCTIRFGRDGRWYADDQPITNPRIADLFATHIERQADGRYVLRIGDEQASIVVEDTPYVVRTVSVDADGHLRVDLNDRSSERLDPTTLEVGADHVLYCRVKGGTERARFLRPAYYQLAPLISAAGPGRFVLRLPGGTYPIAQP